MSTDINSLAGPAAPVTSGSRSIVKPRDSKAPSIKYQPRSKRYYLTSASVPYAYQAKIPEETTALSRRDSRRIWGSPRHTHTREDEVYYVLSGELEVTVGNEVFILIKVILSSPRATSFTSCVILATLKTTISSCSSPPVSKGS